MSLALQQPAMTDQLVLMGEHEVTAKGHFDFYLQRYSVPAAMPVEDVGVVYYQPKAEGNEPVIELKYCILGNRYCNNPACKNADCIRAGQQRESADKPLTLDVVNISFKRGLLQLMEDGEITALFEETATLPFVKSLQPCTKSKLALEQVIHPSYEGTMKNIFLQSKALELLLYSSDQFLRNDTDERYGCRFLTREEDRDKIMQARQILLEHLDAPVTIRDLAKKVAMNENYLKKGFKAMFGYTIYDYFQKERMEKAKQLLYDKGLSVSEVAMMMGYSCISHFSTAFKKHTGLKPCELLLR